MLLTSHLANVKMLILMKQKNKEDKEDVFSLADLLILYSFQPADFSK